MAVPSPSSVSRPGRSVSLGSVSFVDVAQLARKSVATGHLPDGASTTPKIQNGTVTVSALVDGEGRRGIREHASLSVSAVCVGS
jgi:hypothetical protein